MKIYLFLILLCIFPFFVFCQGESIEFQNKLTWELALNLAKRESKKIFIDCYATWCGPCKWMDKNVFNDPLVAGEMNKDYIAIKLQMDSTNTDDSDVVNHRNLSNLIRAKYHINALPTYLFFNSNGEMVEKQSGAYSDSNFLALAKSINNGSNKYSELIRKLDTKSIDSSSLLELFQQATDRSDKEITIRSARQFLDKYEGSIYNSNGTFKEDLVLRFGAVYPLVLTTDDTIFKLVLHADKDFKKIVDNPAYIENLLTSVISREYVPFLSEPYISSENLPDWNSYYIILKNRFGTQVARKVILSSEITYSQKSYQYNSFAKYTLEEIENHSLDTSAYAMLIMNNIIFDKIFKYSTNPDILRRGAKIMKKIIDINSNPNCIDTYANLLYKAGNRSSAVKWEKRAISITPQDKDLQNTLNNMLSNLPTW